MTELKRPTENTPNDFEKVSAWVNAREENFVTQLGAIARESTQSGHEVISYENGIIKKEKPDSIEPGSIFTGSDFCRFASTALADGLSSVFPQMKFTVVKFRTDTNAEMWENPSYTPSKYPLGHFIVAVSGQEEAVGYLDPTYGQINSPEAGKIKSIAADQLQDFYRDVNNRPITPDPTQPNTKEEFLGLLEEENISLTDFNNLVNTIAK